MPGIPWPAFRRRLPTDFTRRTMPCCQTKKLSALMTRSTSSCLTSPTNSQPGWTYSSSEKLANHSKIYEPAQQKIFLADDYWPHRVCVWHLGNEILLLETFAFAIQILARSFAGAANDLSH